MNDLKYVIVVMNNSSMMSQRRHARAIIFNGHISHSSVVPKGFKVLSAGFCSVKNGVLKPEIKCWGQATSLELKSNPEFDAEIIRQTLMCDHPYV